MREIFIILPKPETRNVQNDMKIVRFDNGGYHVRKWTLFGYRYALANGSFWKWFPRNEIKDIHSERYTKERAEKLISTITDIGTPI